MFTTYLVIRALHILVGAIWLGTAVFAAWFLMPAVAEAGPGGAQVMAGIQRRGWIVAVPILAIVSIVSGLWLYWRYTGGFSPELSASHAGMTFGLGGAFAILAAIVGATIGRNLVRANTLTAEAASATDEAARGALLARAQGLRRRAQAAARVVAVLLLVTITLMSVAAFI
jgi:hypothetical protein